MWPCCMLHGCLPVVARILLGPWQVGAKDAHGGCYLGGGRLGVGAEAECGRCCLGGGRLGQRQHKSKGMPPVTKTNLEHSNPAAAD
jgi:hypothetical protein